MKLKQILSEIKLIKPYPKIIKVKDMHSYEYIGGGSEKIKDYIPSENYFILGFEFGKYISFLPFPDDYDNIILNMFPKEYFIDKGRDYWFKEDIIINKVPIVNIIK